MRNRKAKLFLREAHAYLRAAIVLHECEVRTDPNTAKWETRNPLYFLLLHATELALKSVGFARGKTHQRSHDIVKIACEVSEKTDRVHIRAIYKALRELGERRIREKWGGLDGDVAKAARDMELEEVRSCPLYLVYCFKIFGALGQTTMKKYEFGKEVGDWWHGARYPRYGFIRYPNFDACLLICKGIIEVAEQEINK